MKVDVTVPELAESVTEAIVGDWLVQPGEFVEEGEQLVDIETDKVVLEITAPQTGELVSISKPKSEPVRSNEVIAVINTNKKGSRAVTTKHRDKTLNASGPAAPVMSADQPPQVTRNQLAASSTLSRTSPAVRKLAVENNIDLDRIKGSGKDDRITKKDIEHLIANRTQTAMNADDLATKIISTAAPTQKAAVKQGDTRVPMTTLRKHISKRLVQSQHQRATLTTFNEVNMQNIIELRKRYKKSFEEAYGAKLGFMSFFVKAAVEALKEFPVVNASVEDADIIYHDYFDMGVAVSTQRGLIVPILRDADGLSFAAIEQRINDFMLRSQNDEITIEEISGGTFTISNGGVFGSMMSTPIINPPQSAVLGMHSIQDRAIVQNDEIVIAPMMYLALSYDHRIIDGKEAVQFLGLIKRIVEDPNRLLLQI